MKAAWYDEFGPARDVLKLGEIETPQPGPDEVLVRLKSSAVNPSDTKKRAGASPGILDDGAIIPHSDGAGIIEAVGAQVEPGRVGERVWLYQAQHGRRLGTAAQYISIDQRRAVTLPDTAGFDVGACLGIPAMTAHRCVFADGPVDGQSVLVSGGAGRVAHYAIQWAVQYGARVIATASNEADRKACEEAGASAVVNHRESGWGTRAVKANRGEKIDRVIELEFGRNLPELLELVRGSGTIVTYGSAAVPEPVMPFYRMMYLDLLLRMVIVYEMPETAKLAAAKDINRKLEQNLLQHRVSEMLPLEEIARAHEVVEAGRVRGCVVLGID